MGREIIWGIFSVESSLLGIVSQQMTQQLRRSGVRLAAPEVRRCLPQQERGVRHQLHLEGRAGFQRIFAQYLETKTVDGEDGGIVKGGQRGFQPRAGFGALRFGKRGENRLK